MSEEDFDVMYNNCDYEQADQVGHPQQLGLHQQRHQTAGQRNNGIAQQQHNRRNKAQHVSWFPPFLIY